MQKAGLRKHAKNIVMQQETAASLGEVTFEGVTSALGAARGVQAIRCFRRKANAMCVELHQMQEAELGEYAEHRTRSV